MFGTAGIEPTPARVEKRAWCAALAINAELAREQAEMEIIWGVGWGEG